MNDTVCYDLCVNNKNNIATASTKVRKNTMDVARIYGYKRPSAYWIMGSKTCI